MTGIYFLIRKKKVIYIGQTCNFPARVKNHHIKKFDTVRFMQCLKRNLSMYERRWIARFKPYYNKSKGIMVVLPRTRSHGKTHLMISIAKSYAATLTERAILDERSLPNYITYLLHLSLDGPAPETTKAKLRRELESRKLKLA